MKARLGWLLCLSVAVAVLGCGGTSSETSSTLTFNMSVLQDNGEFSIYGMVFNDLNGDGLMNDGAGGVADAKVSLVGTGFSKTTGSDGLFDFDDLEAGAYSVNVAAPLGYAHTTSNEVAVLVEGEVDPVNFGLQLVEEPPFVDVKPGSDVNPLNLRSKGVLPVAVCGSEGFDVMDVDPATLLLEGVAALRWSYEDVCGYDDMGMDPDMYGDDEEIPDGYMDLTLKFDTQKIAIAILGGTNDISRGDTVTLTMEGKLYDGSTISGDEMVWIVQVPKY